MLNIKDMNLLNGEVVISSRIKDPLPGDIEPVDPIN